MGGYREQSPLWQATSSNLTKAKPPPTAGKNMSHLKFDGHRVAYSHEYIGPASPVRDTQMPTPEQRARPYKYKGTAA
jgi:hypothetical protein